MELDIRKSIINKIKDDNEEEILSTINESVITNNELVLPGRGVLLELFWNELSKSEKIKITNIIKNNIKKEN